VVKLITAEAYGTDSVSNVDAAKRRRNELWQALNRFCREAGASVTNVPGISPLRIEISKTSNLPTQLIDAGYAVHQAGRIMRIVGNRETPFEERDIVEIDLPRIF
jgi:hypothetical protein